MRATLKFTGHFNGDWLRRLGMFIETIESSEFRLRVDYKAEKNEMIVLKVPQWFGHEGQADFAFFKSTIFDLGDIFNCIAARGFRTVAMEAAESADKSQDWNYRYIQAA